MTSRVIKSTVPLCQNFVNYAYTTYNVTENQKIKVKIVGTERTSDNNSLILLMAPLNTHL